MSISFFPSRSSMIREVERLIAAGSLDTLVSLCNCCLFKTFDMDYECQACEVRIGIRLIGRESRRDIAEEDELLGVC